MLNELTKITKAGAASVYGGRTAGPKMVIIAIRASYFIETPALCWSEETWENNGPSHQVLGSAISSKTLNLRERRT